QLLPAIALAKFQMPDPEDKERIALERRLQLVRRPQRPLRPLDAVAHEATGLPEPAEIGGDRQRAHGLATLEGQGDRAAQVVSLEIEPASPFGGVSDPPRGLRCAGELEGRIDQAILDERALT